MEDRAEVMRKLELISAKLYALGELIKFRGGEPSLDEERVNWGLGKLLTDIADDLHKASEHEATHHKERSADDSI